MTDFIMAVLVLWVVVFSMMSVVLHHVDQEWRRTFIDTPTVMLIAAAFTLSVATIALVFGQAFNLAGGGA